MKNTDFDKKVGEYLKKYRLEHDMTQEQMGASIGRTRLWYIEKEN